MLNEFTLTKDMPWLNSWPPKVPNHLSYPKIPLQGLLEANLQEYGEKTAVVYDEQKISYSHLDSLSNQFANSLIKLAVNKGDRVAIFLPNIPQFLIAYFGILKAGGVATTISPLHREREVEYQLCDSGAQTIVTLDKLYPIVENITEKTLLKHVIATGLSERGFPELLRGVSEDRPRVEINPGEDLAALQYTGGTTGTFKGAMLTHSNLVSNALAFAAMIEGTTQDTFLTALPLFHIYGMTTSMTVPICLAAKMVLQPKFDPSKALELIQKHRVTVFCGVPTMYSILLATPDLTKYDLTSIRVCISGASSLPPQVQKRFMEVTGGFLAEGYGLTEASPVTHCTPVDKSVPLRVGSIGLPLPDTEARIVDIETERALSVGEVGELAIKGPQVMKGYWQNPKETDAVLQDGWLLTGDIARMDSDGYFYIVDRKKDLIKHNGYSVYPRELEDTLYEHPAVKLCAVVGKPDVASGEDPAAFVVLKEGMLVTAEELMAFVNAKIAQYKAIRYVEFRKDLPISSAGKVLRRQLKKQM
jgi:long-chain acyl-CoA synthetase